MNVEIANPILVNDYGSTRLPYLAARSLPLPVKLCVVGAIV